MTKYHIQITQEDVTDDSKGLETGRHDILSVRVDEDPSKAVMRLLAAEKRGPRKSKDSTRKPEGASK